MKIFNWMHRHRFPDSNVHSSKVSLVEDGSSFRRSEGSFSKVNIEKEPLLEEEVKAVEGWELDGILAIGTLAIDPLKTINLQDEEGDNGEIEQSYNRNDHHDEHENYTMLLKEGPKCDIGMCKLDVTKRCSNEIEVVEEEIMYEKLTNMVKRVTLLDLFLADEVNEDASEKANAAYDCGEDNFETKVIEKAKKKKKMHILYSKLPAALGGKKGSSPKANNDDDIRPLKKLNRLMTRMMKRKIHPADMEARVQKKGQGKLNDDVSMGTDVNDSTNDQYAAYEYVSLLPTQGIVV